MAVIRLTKVFTFDMAHALHNYNGLCKNIHGHTYQLEVTVKGVPSNDADSPKKGMVIDFSDLKKLVNREIIDKWDHSLLINNQVNAQLIELLKTNYERINIVDYQPTSENMLCDIAEKISCVLPAEIQLYSLKLKETNNSFVEWFANENE